MAPSIGPRGVRSRPRRLALSALGALAIVAASASPAWADPTPEEKAGARAAAEEGNAAYAQKRYADALDRFKRAESLMHASTHLLMIARSEVALGQLVAARETYLSLIKETLGPKSPSAFKDAQTAAKPELAALEPRVPTLGVNVDDPKAIDVEITMDGALIPSTLIGIARPVDPGTHVLKARGKGVVSDEKSVVLAEGAKESIVLALRPAPEEAGAAPKPPPKIAPTPVEPDHTLEYLGWTGVGVGGAGLVVGGVFLGLGFAKRSEADDAYVACGSEACVEGTPGALAVNDLDDDANLKQTVGLISAIAGGAIAATGVVLLIVAPSDGGEASAYVTPYVGPGSLGVRGAF